MLDDLRNDHRLYLSFYFLKSLESKVSSCCSKNSALEHFSMIKLFITVFFKNRKFLYILTLSELLDLFELRTFKLRTSLEL